ncbi:MAG: mechanosensitive ion channel [Neisseriaceae bacterium]|nr:mechanosensitive ion channel [Neisseriaceae bacterium]
MSSFFSISAWSDFLQSLFERQEFISYAIKHNFFKPLSIIEFIIAVVLWIGLAWLVNRKSKHIHAENGLFKYWLSRLNLPIILMIVGSIAAFAWKEFSGSPTLWLRLVVITAPWLMIIRTIMVFLHYIFPEDKFSIHTAKTLSAIIWVGYVLWLSGIGEIASNFAKKLAVPIGGKTISLYMVVTGIFWVIIALIVAMSIARFLELRLSKAEKIDANLRIVLSKILKSILAILAVIITLPIIGIDLTVLSVFGGALGIGLGFGLQKIASNYVSGFIILLDRSVRMGDRLTLNGVTGVVTKITSRFVVLKSTAGTEALIPNESFIGNTVLNDTYSNRSLWRSLPVQVAYGSDLRVVMDILKTAAERHARIESADAFVSEFASDGINLTLGYWLLDPENSTLKLNSDILFEIWDEFQKHGIEIPFPQREIRVLNDFSEFNHQDNDEKQNNELQ